MITQNNNDNLIGYDPLAWMEQVEPPENSDHSESEVLLTSEASKSTELAQSATVLNAVETSAEDVATIVLQTTQNLQNIAQLHEKLLRALDHSSNVITIDASPVQSIDTATLQLFVALKQETLRVNRDLQFDFPSDRFLEACGLLGLLTMLQVDKLPAGLF